MKKTLILDLCDHRIVVGKVMTFGFVLNHTAALHIESLAHEHIVEKFQFLRLGSAIVVV